MAKKILSVILMVAGMTPAWAETSLPSQLAACLAIPGVLQRLACYDGVARTVSPGPQRTAPAPRPMASAPPPAYVAPPIAAAAAASADLGSERLPRTASAAPRRPQEMIAGVTQVNYDPRGRFTITLDNGQVWRQLEGDTNLLSGARISAVRISRGALGSYDLNIVGRNASYRVMRLQ